MPASAGRATSSTSSYRYLEGGKKRESSGEKSELLLAEFDVEDSRKRDDGTTSADLLREKIRIVRARVRQVQSFSSTGSPLKEQRKEQQQQRRLSSSTGRPRSVPELGYIESYSSPSHRQSADTARTSTRSSSSARPLRSGDQGTDESGSLLEPAGGRPRVRSSSSAASFLNSYGSVQSATTAAPAARAEAASCTGAATTTTITSTVFRTDEESAEALAAPLLLRTDEEEEDWGKRRRHGGGQEQSSGSGGGGSGSNIHVGNTPQLWRGW